ncbi:MAG: hypothetical protein KAT14_07865 [Candidatus Marinimicrobia bacterium]|nr:hypothetical protein [Candidatus Neomarinimicrobiota bacterium]
MKYKLINTGNTDQYIPLVHANRENGAVGAASKLSKKLIIPGKARAADGENFILIDEDVLRSVFGLYEKLKPGVIDRTKPVKISPDNVKLNVRLLDSGRIIVTNEYGKHVFGIGGDAYQKSAIDNLQTENEMLKEKMDILRQVLVNDGFSEEDANAVLSAKSDQVQGILKKRDGIRSRGMSRADEKGISPLSAAKIAFKDQSTVIVMCGDDEVQEYKFASLNHAVKKIAGMAADAGIKAEQDETGLPFFIDKEERMVKLV